MIDSVFTEGERTTYVVRYLAEDLCNTDNECISHIVIDNSSFIVCPEDLVIQAPPHGFTNVDWPTPRFQTCCTECKPRNIPGFLYMGQLGNSYYYCSFARVNWSKAQRLSQENGGHLAVINSMEENDFIARRLIEREAYIGLTDSEVEGEFQWVSGSSDFTRWKPGQPDNAGNEDFVEMNAQGYWYDVDGKTKREFVMEIEGCSNVYQIGGPRPGSKFRVGSTTITYRAEDGCGNTDVCSFDVVLLPYEPEEQMSATMRSVEKTEFLIAPNPASEFIQIQSGGADRITSIRIYDVTGKLMDVDQSRSFNSMTIDVGGMNPGVYLLRIESEYGNVVVEKVIIE